jgi:DNA excision repair protein ERCC-3
LFSKEKTTWPQMSMVSMAVYLIFRYTYKIMINRAEKPLIVQSDKTLLLDVHAPEAEDARAAILPFAELEKSPEHIHTYRITPLSLWNAASAGLTPADVITALNTYSRYEVPAGICNGFSDTMARYGKIQLRSTGNKTGMEELLLSAADETIEKEIAAAGTLTNYLVKTEGGFKVKLTDRGTVKQELIKLGWPVEDEASLRTGEHLELELRENCGTPAILSRKNRSRRPFVLRDYQTEAARALLGKGGPGTGFGVIVLP